MALTKIIQRFLIFISALFLTLTISINHINAQTTPFFWEFINVDIVIENNGDILVTETQKYTFTKNHTNQRYRYIPLDKVKQITDVSVSENNLIIPSDTGIKNNQLWISWKHPLNPPESHTFVIKYRVIGGLYKSGDNLQVYWKAIFPERSSAIKKSRVTVTFPEELAGKIINYQSFGVPSEAKKIDNKTIEFIATKELPPQTELEVKITFPKGILNLPEMNSSNSSFQSSDSQNSSKFIISKTLPFHRHIMAAMYLMIYCAAILFGNFLFNKLDGTLFIYDQIPSLDDYEIAYLAGGKEGVMNLIVAQLMHSGNISFNLNTGFYKTNIQRQNSHPVEKFSLSQIYDDYDENNRIINQTITNLIDKKLILTPELSNELRLIGAVPTILVGSMLFPLIFIYT